MRRLSIYLYRRVTPFFVHYDKQRFSSGPFFNSMFLNENLCGGCNCLVYFGTFFYDFEIIDFR